MIITNTLSLAISEAMIPRPVVAVCAALRKPLRADLRTRVGLGELRPEPPTSERPTS